MLPFLLYYSFLLNVSGTDRHNAIFNCKLGLLISMTLFPFSFLIFLEAFFDDHFSLLLFFFFRLP